MSDAPPERSLAGLSEMLGRATHGYVRAEDIAWEASSDFLTEAVTGRRVLFLSAARPGKSRDLYRAWVRVTWSGQPIAIYRLRNLTETPLGDDAALEVGAGTAAFATLAYGKVQSVSVLDLDGVREMDRPPSLFDRTLLGINSLQTTGTFAGIGRTDIVLDVPASSVRMRLSPEELEIDLGDQARALRYDLVERRLQALDGGQAYAARAVPEVHHPKPFVLWSVDTLRAEIGPEPIAWLENQVFGAEDAVKRASFALQANSEQFALKSAPVASAAPKRAPAVPVSEVPETWPPAAIPSLWKEVLPGEGEWQPVTHSFLEPLPHADRNAAKPPAYFYRAFIRPDPKRPYAKLTLVAMDMRQLEIGMQAGFEDPKPLTGPPGDGYLPRDPAVLERVVATFNGAFKTTHGAYGMMVNRRILLPPVRGAASIVVREDGETTLGSWPQIDQIPPEIVSFRQNLDPLVEDGVPNPRGRFLWGWQVAGTSVLTHRTAICVTPAGHLYYAFASEIDGPTLGRALQQAGCSYGIHLDMNPAHCGFVFTHIVDMKAREFNLRLADPDMKIPPDKFVRWSAKDFFYVMVRDAWPRPSPDLRWQPDAGAQPPPAWSEGIFKAEFLAGNVSVEVSSFERGRVNWKIAAGTKEPHVQLKKAAEPAARVLAAVGLGHTTEALRYGLVLSGTSALALSPAYATLVVGPDGMSELRAPGQVALSAGSQAVQLPLLAEDGRLLPNASDHGPMRTRGALCVTGSGRVLVARARHDSNDPLALALIRAGCSRVVELDRGSSHPAFVHRAGTATPPLPEYEMSVLYAFERPMLPHASRWTTESSQASTTPTGYDYPPPKEQRAGTPTAPAALKLRRKHHDRALHNGDAH